MLGGSAGTGRACAAAARGGAGEERWESDLENRGKSAATPPTFCGALPPFSLKAAVEAWLAGVSLALFPSLMNLLDYSIHTVLTRLQAENPAFFADYEARLPAAAATE